MTDYEGKERRTADRREHEPAPVAIEGWKNGAQKDIDTAIRLGRSILGVLIVGAFGLGGWVVRDEMTNSAQDESIGAHVAADSIVQASFAEAISEINRTMATVVAEQKALRRDYEREHGQ